jgi:sugar phosphate isomerase/epimerase
LIRTIRGPGLFLAQFIGPEPPFDSLDGLAAFASGLGFKGLQIPTFDPGILDIALAAESDAYCDEIRGLLAHHGVQIAELASQRFGHLLAVHLAYDDIADRFAPPALRGRPAARRQWAGEQLRLAARAAARLGVAVNVTFSGSLLWPYFYPYPPFPKGLIEDGFAELARRWRPILDAFDEAGVDLAFELHPGEDLHDGATFERLLEAVGGHPRMAILYDPSHLFLQHMDYLGFIDRYHDRIRAFHVKDAEYLRNDRSGVYGGYQDWLDRAGRFRSPGDGQIDFGGIFSRLTRHGYDGWACLEWECCLKNRLDGAREGAAFIARHIIHVTEQAFDAPMRGMHDAAANARLLGLGRDD